MARCFQVPTAVHRAGPLFRQQQPVQLAVHNTETHGPGPKASDDAYSTPKKQIRVGMAAVSQVVSPSSSQHSKFGDDVEAMKEVRMIACLRQCLHVHDLLCTCSF